MSNRSKVQDIELRRAKNIESHINGLRLSGHAFSYRDGIVRCVGCDLGISADWQNGEYKHNEAARKLVKEHGDCAKPWNLEKRIAEINAKYAPKSSQESKGSEVTLETIDAKLEKIIRYLGIW